VIEVVVEILELWLLRRETTYDTKESSHRYTARGEKHKDLFFMREKTRKTTVKRRKTSVKKRG
jgi:hypothetical protein